MSSRNKTGKIRALIVDDDEDDWEIVNALLTEERFSFELVWTDSLKGAIERLGQNDIDVVLLDLHLSDSRGLPTFTRLHSRRPEVPVVILSTLIDERQAIEAVREGAQDCLVKGKANGKMLARVLRFAVERHQSQTQQRNAGTLDKVTGLLTWKGFETLAEQHLKVAQRTKRSFFLYFVILDGLAEINRSFGKSEGNQALVTAATILRECFRTSDLIARMGTDEFAILPPEPGHYSPKIITARLQKSQTYHSAQYNRYRLSLSLCVRHFDPKEISSIKDLMRKAQEVLFDYKRQRKTAPSLIYK